MFNKISKNIYLILTILAVTAGIYYRVGIALKTTTGGDYNTHLRAVTELLSGINPYIETIKSFNNLEKDPGNKGYAYFPGIMYVNTFLFLIHLILRLNFGIYTSVPFLFELPGIIASIFVCIFFIKYFNKKDNLAMMFCTLYWLLDPYLISRHLNLSYDAVTIALLLWSLYYLEKDDVISSTLFSLGVIIKTFPITLLSIFLLRSKNKIVFIATGIIIFLSFSIPFFRSFNDFSTYIQGSLLVHGNRFVQGRPFLYYISYLYSIELFRIIPFSFYSISSIVSGWLWPFLFKIKNFITDKYELSIFPFLSFYILTPVLNRTYMIWAIPFFLLGSYKILEKKHKWAFYVVNLAYWLFSYWYLAQWKDGFHIRLPVFDNVSTI